MEEVKKKSGSIVVIIILLLLVLVLVGYIVYDKMVVKENATEIKEETKAEIEELNIDDDLVVKLFNIFRMDKSCYLSVDGLNNDNLTRLRIAYDNCPISSFGHGECKDFEKDKNGFCGKMNELMLKAYNEKDQAKFDEYEKANWTETLDAKILEAKYHELFGSGAPFKNESFGIGATAEPTCYFMKYNETINKYGEFLCEGGVSCLNKSQTITKATKQNDTLTITTELKLEDRVMLENNVELDNTPMIITYEFQKDEKLESYAFVKATESKKDSRD